ncbi:hypothetical protein BMF94_0403 [Rhodotorula taiwanensis]|uniref:Inhibitor I9 domain-containing protein n=1 Tax=Rhodotorula taiwanensis TaxID=741276 RepID=A0A2S5BHF7_9BASI|nr:hypothetical protein BMF94_0403 [Rhodotorula taiwanensis]
MRWLASLVALCLLLYTVALAEPIPRQAEAPARRERVFGRPANAVQQRDDKQRQVVRNAEADRTTNYLVTLDRSINNVNKDKILDVLLRLGAVVKQEYDYRVYKGILFTVPASADKGLTSWSSALASQDGVKYVEKDEVVKANAGDA